MLIHRFVYRRTNHANFHVRGYKEEGTTTTPFDMVVRNELDRFHLALEALRRVAKAGRRSAKAARLLRRQLAEHSRYITTHGEDLPMIREWKWELSRSR